MPLNRDDAHHLQNYSTLLMLNSETLLEQEGRFALVASGEVVDFFDTNREALSEAYSRGLAGKYSVMRVETKPEDMGFFDCANYPR